MPIPAVLSIAGSDSGGGAGIQADLKAFAASGVHGMTAITAITAQNTVAVEAVYMVPPQIILAQVRAVAADLGVDAVKVGMLGDAATIAAVAEAIAALPAQTPVVVDPVMVAESGGRLLAEEAQSALVELLLPRATVVTPNVPEAMVLANHSPRAGAPGAPDAPHGPDGDDLRALARAVHALGPAHVVVTGGHRDDATDLYFDGDRFEELPGERYPGGAAHGSGCTHSSALAARLALGDTPLQAARTAKAIAAEAVRDGLRGLGKGAGPVNVLGLCNALDSSRGPLS
jgi:hydroxymethylpyrimidine/phosphomethylpyrimidine kinase